LPKRIDQCILGQLLGQLDVADVAGQRGDDARELNTENGLDGGG
jgi:hypothetical protein